MSEDTGYFEGDNLDDDIKEEMRDYLLTLETQLLVEYIFSDKTLCDEAENLLGKMVDLLGGENLYVSFGLLIWLAWMHGSMIEQFVKDRGEGTSLKYIAEDIKSFYSNGNLH